MSSRSLWMMGRWALVVGAVGACANPAAEQAMYAQSALVGMSKQALLSCAGVPERQASVGNLEYFTYDSRRLVSYPGWGGYGGYWGPRYGYGPGWPTYAGDISTVDCEATFTLRNGSVERVVYGGGSRYGSGLGQCYTIVQNCIAQLPQQTPAPSASPTR